MSKYKYTMKGVIYKITSKNMIYIGSTERTLKQRLECGHHRAFKKYDFDYFDYQIEILDEIEYIDKNELYKLEGIYMDKYDCVNIQCPKGFGKNKVDYDKLRYENNKINIINSTNNFYHENKEVINYKRSLKRKYIFSWGGDSRSYDTTNLLNIDPTIFTDF